MEKNTHIKEKKKLKERKKKWALKVYMINQKRNTPLKPQCQRLGDKIFKQSSIRPCRHGPDPALL